MADCDWNAYNGSKVFRGHDDVVLVGLFQVRDVYYFFQVRHALPPFPMLLDALIRPRRHTYGTEF